VQEDGRVYRFRLHSGVRFHDGTPCDAEAVKWNVMHVMDPKNKAQQAQFFTMVESVEVLDAQTLDVSLKFSSSVWLPSLAIHGGGGLRTISPTAYERWGKDFGLHPSGTGPFRLGHWEQNRVIVLEKNPDYFKPGLPHVDRVELDIMKDGVTRVAALRAREVDFVNWVPREHAKRLEEDPKIQLWRGPETTGVFIVPTLSRKPWDDLRVRRAVLGYGLDREVMAKAALLGYGRPLVSLVAYGLRGHVSLREMYPYDPVKAKALLKEAGFDDKHPLRYGVIARAADPVLPTVATIMKTQLEKIGVQISVEVLDRPIYLKRHLSYDRDQSLVIAYPRPDLYSFAYVLSVSLGSLIYGVGAMVRNPCDRASRHRRPLAPRRVSPARVVGAWAEAARTARDRLEDPCADPQHEPREYPLGCATSPRRTGDAWHQGVTDHRGEIHGLPTRSVIAVVAHVHTPPRP
jgi:ABC-type transport system substrate-binding protein